MYTVFVFEGNFADYFNSQDTNMIAFDDISEYDVKSLVEIAMKCGMDTVIRKEDTPVTQST